MRRQPAMQGAASILIILIMLSMTLFGVLALMSAYSDYRLAVRNAEFIQQYYAVDSEAFRLVAEVGPLIARNADNEEYQALGWQTVAAYKPMLMREVSVGEHRLSIALELHEAGSYRITQWQLAPHEFDYTQNSAPVWDGRIPGLND